MATRRTAPTMAVVVSRSFLLGVLFGGIVFLTFFGGRSFIVASFNGIRTGVLRTATLASHLVSKTRLFFLSIFHAPRLTRRVEELQHQVMDLKALTLQLLHYAEENQRLRKLLGLRRSLKTPTLAAEVVAIGGSNWFRTIIVNKGGKEGVRKGALVIDHRGVIGRVWEVRPDHSIVLLMTDRRFAIGVKIAGRHPEVYGVVKGLGNEWCELSHLSRYVPLREGEKVITAGIGSPFPEGLPVGTIVQIRRGRFLPTALVRPFTQGRDCHEVLILAAFPGR